LNRYTYVLNSPMNYTDPSGFFWWLIAPMIEAISAAASSALEAVGTAFSSAVGDISGAAAVKAAAADVAVKQAAFEAAKTALGTAVASEAKSGVVIGLLGAKIDAAIALNGATSSLLSAQSAFMANLTNAGVLGVGMATEGMVVGVTQAAGKGSLGPLPNSPTGNLIRQMHGGGGTKNSGITIDGPRGRASEARVLKDMGLPKNNNKTVSTSEGRSKPDALTTNQSVEIKDSARVSLTRQLRIQTEAARNAGQQSVLVTGDKTCVSGPCSRAFDQVIRRPDLGPQK